MKKLFLLFAIIILFTSCGVSFEQASKPILEKYGQPDIRSIEKANEYTPDGSYLYWAYKDLKLQVIFSREGNKWESKLIPFDF
jgi:hypothetical protein